MKLFQAIAALTFTLTSFAASAADYPAPKQGDWFARDFKFHTGEMMSELKIHYTTIGEPTGQPVLVLHGTGGSGGGMLTPAFAGELFGPGQPLDAAKYYIIIPDAIGHGKSAKPSDGLKTKFPQYDYADYDAAPTLDRIEASLLAINAADDERNPPETGVMVNALKQVKNGKLYLIPASEQTSGHLTTGNAKFYRQQLLELLQAAPQRAM